MKFVYDDKRFGELKKAWGWLVAFGIIMILAGVFGLGWQFLATQLTVYVFAFFLFAGGAFQFIQAYYAKTSSIRWYAVLFGIIYVIAAIFIIANPFSAAIALTLLLAWFLIFIGIVRAYLAWQIRPSNGWGVIMISALASLILGILILADWPSSGIWTIGMLVSIELLFTGITFVSLGMSFKNV